ncbi:hypothetical protein Tco_1110860 [Tanacetum coccineum]|uniref:Uncharacterized protein n=1 Tax=Tanacetum coccineum TaxID=301880 RepID=A0ABQ5IK26_9ASTR
MACIEEILKEAKLIEIDDQLLVLIKRQVQTELMLEKKFKDLCEEVSNFVEEIKDVVKEVERLRCKDMANETLCLFRRGQKRTGYSLKDKIEAKTDKTEHGMEERDKVKVKAETKEMLNGPTRTHLMVGSAHLNIV